MDSETLLVRHQAIGYGRDAREILETGELFSEIERTWSSADLYVFKGRAGIHDKVFQKIIAISKDQRLKSFIDTLPTSYNALFSLTRYTDNELKEAVAQGVISPKTSYRVIDNWRKTYGRNTLDEQESLFEVLPDVEIKVVYNNPESVISRKVKEELAVLVTRIPEVKVTHSLPPTATARGILPGARTPARVKLALGQAIDERAGVFLEEGSLMDLKKHRLTRTQANELKNLSLKAFKELLQKIVGNQDFWTRCGEIYQYRIALEVAKADDYANKDKHFSTLITNARKYGLENTTNEIIILLNEE